MDLVQAFQNFGFASVCLACFGAAVWKITTYVVREILKPMAEKHIQFIDALEAGQKSRDDTMRQIAEIQAEQARQLAEQTGLLKGIKAGTVTQTKLMLEDHGGPPA